VRGTQHAAPLLALEAQVLQAPAKPARGVPASPGQDPELLCVLVV
jgi:hypothetical protein